MSRPATTLASLILFLTAINFASADSTKVIITVEKPGDKQPAAATKPPFRGQRPTVDVAILLDTSNSMDGLINQAKSQLWTIVQQFATAKREGQTPALRVALFEYGNLSLPASEGYIRQVVPLTDDLDKLSEALFGLRTNGGDEYCGQVIDVAVQGLDWSKEPNGYKAIFIAGNEPFTQGSVDYKDACKKAIGRGIVVNTIHCGNNSEGLNGMWSDGAKLAEGEFFNIDQDRAVVQIRCPQDEIIIKLNTELNKTYLWYGAESSRRYYSENQVAQDTNAAQSGPSTLAGRAAAKVSDMYSNRGRDLVDELRADKDVLRRVKSEELPEELQNLSADEREKLVKETAAKRASLQQKIAELSKEREAYLAQEQKRLAEASGEATLGDAVVTTIQKQLTQAGFEQSQAAE